MSMQVKILTVLHSECQLLTYLHLKFFGHFDLKSTQPCVKLNKMSKIANYV